MILTIPPETRWSSLISFWLHLPRCFHHHVGDLPDSQILNIKEQQRENCKSLLKKSKMKSTFRYKKCLGTEKCCFRKIALEMYALNEIDLPITKSQLYETYQALVYLHLQMTMSWMLTDIGIPSIQFIKTDFSKIDTGSLRNFRNLHLVCLSTMFPNE